MQAGLALCLRPFCPPVYIPWSEDRLSEPRSRPQAWSGMGLAPGGPRLLCVPRRIYLVYRPGDLGPHGQNWRPPRSELSISNRPDKLLGTHPVNWFLSRASPVRLARLPNSAGISPLNWFPSRSSSVTRPLSSVVTPSHSLIGTSLSQLLFLLQFGPPVAL